MVLMNGDNAMDRYVLAFDTANEVVAVGLGVLDPAQKQVKLHASVEIDAHRASNTTLLPTVDELLNSSGVAREALACVCVGRGPGSFTGVRIAMATAKGIASGLGVGLIGVSSLDAVAWNVWAAGERGSLAVVADAMRKEVYPVRYLLDTAGAHRLEADRVVKAQLAAQELAGDEGCLPELLLAGDGLFKYAEAFAVCGSPVAEDLWTPTGRGLLLALQAAWQTGDVDPFDTAQHNPAYTLPVYTRLSDAEENERIRLAKNDPKNLVTGVQDVDHGELAQKAAVGTAVAGGTAEGMAGTTAEVAPATAVAKGAQTAAAEGASDGATFATAVDGADKKLHGLEGAITVPEVIQTAVRKVLAAEEAAHLRKDQRTTMHDTAILNARPDAGGITYKPLDAAHASQVADLEQQVMGSDAWSTALVLDELPRTDRTWWYAEADGLLVGYAGGWVVDGDVQILKIGVSPQWRRHGIARKLLARVAEDARDLGAQSCSLEVRVSNEGAQRFYEQAGLTALGKRPRYYSDGEDALIMSGKLPVLEHDVAGMTLAVNNARATQVNPHVSRETSERGVGASGAEFSDSAGGRVTGGAGAGCVGGTVAGSADVDGAVVCSAQANSADVSDSGVSSAVVGERAVCGADIDGSAVANSADLANSADVVNNAVAISAAVASSTDVVANVAALRGADVLSNTDASALTSRRPLIFAIESSCDETAAALVDGEGELLADVVASQIDFHARFGGVVPEIASRKHIEAICGVCDECFDQAAQALGVPTLTWSDLDAVAVTYAPGLVGALVVGVAFAKGAAWAADKPFIGVHHLEGHLYANKIGAPDFAPPAVVSLVSGGNTMLVYMRDWGDYETLGATIDDAVGEAFDKVAKALGLGYPGGPAISREAAKGDANAIAFPRAMMHSGDLRFSLSGLKTAVVTYINGEREAGRELHIPNICASFQQAVVDVQVKKADMALKQTGAKTFCLGGGVAANPVLRHAYEQLCEKRHVRLIMPPLSACGDNAGMIALVALDRFADEKFFGLDCDAYAHLDLDKPY